MRTPQHHALVPSLALLCALALAACSGESAPATGSSSQPASGASSQPAAEGKKEEKKEGDKKTDKKTDKKNGKDEKKDEKDEKDEKKAGKPAKKEGMPSAEMPPAGTPVVFPGSPYDEEFGSFRLHWRGADGETPLHASFDKTSPEAGKLAVKKDGIIAWRESRLKVTEPIVVVASSDTQIADASPLDQPQESKEVTIPKGGEVRIFKYEGEGTCILGIEGKLVSATCPQRESFTSAGWDGKHTPPGYEWWVQVEGHEGWLRVDGEKVEGEAVQETP